MLAFGITYSLLLILFGLCTEARWRLGGAMAVLLLAGPVGYASWLFVGAGLCGAAPWMQKQRLSIRITPGLRGKDHGFESR